jgi:hypothetical protein
VLIYRFLKRHQAFIFSKKAGAYFARRQRQLC